MNIRDVIVAQLERRRARLALLRGLGAPPIMIRAEQALIQESRQALLLLGG